MKHNLVATMLLLFSAAVAVNAQNVTAERPMKVRVSYQALDTFAVKKVLPSTPCSNEANHEEGTVRIAVLVDSDGTIKTARRDSGDPVLADCAIAAIRQWQFRPYILNNTPVQIESSIVVKFSKGRSEVVPGNTDNR